MKKLTAGIFATLLAVVSADGAYAAIASKGYVDEQVGAVESTVSTINETVTNLGDTINNAETGLGKQVEDLKTTVAGKADSSTVTALGGRVTTAEGEIDTLQTQMAGKADTADLGDLATLDAVGSAQITDGAVATTDIADKAVTEAKLSDTVNASLDKADTAVQPAAISDMLTKTEAGTTYYTKTSGDALAGRVTTAEGEIDAIQAEMDNMATDENLALKQDKTDNNLATTNKTVVGAINEVKTTADDANTAAGAAQDAADAAQEAAEAAQATANAAIPKPSGECSDPANKCVLTFNNSAYAWEVIERGAEE